MSAPQPRAFDPQLDLMVERVVTCPRSARGRRGPSPIMCASGTHPAPGVISECEIDLRPGGVFRFVPRQPDGTENPTTCCYLEVVPHRRLVWTDALLPGYRPAPTGFFTAVMTLEPRGDTTLCTAVAMHRNEDDRNHPRRDGVPRRLGHGRSISSSPMRRHVTGHHEMNACATSSSSSGFRSTASPRSPATGSSTTARSCSTSSAGSSRPQTDVLLGRGTYDYWVDYWPTSDVEPFASFINATRKHVATSSDLTGDWENTVADDVTGRRLRRGT